MTWADRKKRSGIMLCYPFEEKRLAKWEPPYIVQPKLDGVRCRAVWDRELGYTLLSSTESVIESVPHINQALNDTGLRAELDGELYTHGSSFEDIVSVSSRTVNLHQEFDKLQYHVFDVVAEVNQLTRASWLSSNLKAKPPIVMVPTYVANNLEQILNYYVQFLNKGYEGIIVRHTDAIYKRARSTFVMKFKPKKDDWYKVVGYKEEVDKHGEPKNRLGALICCGDDGTEFSVGSGLTDADREKLWASRDWLAGSFCRVQYQHITPGKGVPRFPIYMEVM